MQNGMDGVEGKCEMAEKYEEEEEEGYLNQPASPRSRHAEVRQPVHLLHGRGSKRDSRQRKARKIGKGHYMTFGNCLCKFVRLNHRQMLCKPDERSWY